MKRRTPKGEPHVGIFWVVNGKLVIDSTHLGRAEPYDDCLTHPRSHIEVWEQWRLGGKAPSESEYEEFPRGRVMYNAKTQRFTLLADKCILKDKDMVSTIISAMNLPSETTDKGTDKHYRCSACLQDRDEINPPRQQAAIMTADPRSPRDSILGCNWSNGEDVSPIRPTRPAVGCLQMS